MVLDDDPLIEMYYDRKRKVGRDTSIINTIIKKGELDKYFEKLK